MEPTREVSVQPCRRRAGLIRRVDVAIYERNNTNDDDRIQELFSGLVHLDWHAGNGFVIQCYEDEQSLSYFLVTSGKFSAPSIDVELGGLALERWPDGAIVAPRRAAQAAR